MSDIQPLQNRVQIVKDDGTPTDFFIRWAKQRQIDISGGITAIEAQALIDAWALARDVNAGVGLSGGGNLSTDITVDLENTAVTPGSYSSADITVDAQGRITAAANGAGGTPLEVEDEGVSIETATTKINFVGAGVTATNPAAGEVDVTIPGGGSALEVEDEGVSIETATTVVDFVGSGVTVTSAAAGEVQVDIPGGGWTSAASWDFSSGGAVASVIADVTGANDVLIECLDAGLSISGQRQIQFSVDGGATYFSTSGNYQDVSTAGIGANNAAIIMHDTAATAIRRCSSILYNISSTGSAKTINNITRRVMQTFAGSLLPITHIRVNGSGGGNFNAGSIRIWKR